MKVWIIEDESACARSLERQLKELRPDLVIAGQSGSIANSISGLNCCRDVDVIFADILLDDGLSFAIFEQVKMDAMIVFTTAYNDFAMKAFEYNCVDYLLKPIQREDLERMLIKVERFLGKAQTLPAGIQKDIMDLASGRHVYRSQILLRRGNEEIVRSIEDIGWLEADAGFVRVYLFDGTWGDTPETLKALSESLSPTLFHRINRQVILNLSLMDGVSHGPGRDYLVHLKSPFTDRTFLITPERKKSLFLRLKV